MASHLTILSAFGAAPTKSVAPAANKADRRDDSFARLVEPETKPAAPAQSNSAASSSAPKPADNRGSAPADGDTQIANAASIASEPEEQDESSATEASLPEALLAALAAVVTTPDEQAEGSPLKEIENALGELADAMGIDMASLIQQIQKLAEAAGLSGEAGPEAEGEFLAKLTDLVAKTIGVDVESLDPEIQANLTRLVDGAKKFAQLLPTEPELAEPALKLPETVLTGKADSKQSSEGEGKAADGVGDKDASKRVAPDMALRADRPANNDANRPAPGQTAAGGDVPELSLVQQTSTDSVKLPTDSSAALPRVVQAGYQTSQQQINLPQIAFEMARQVDGGNTRFQIRLDPPELGRIDVKLDIDSNGQVNARLTVEKAETLDLMQRDQRALERALQQAGLDASKTNLEFSLKQNPFAGDQNDRPEQGGGMAEHDETGTQDTETAPAVTLYRGALQASGLNIIA